MEFVWELLCWEVSWKFHIGFYMRNPMGIRMGNPMGIQMGTPMGIAMGIEEKNVGFSHFVMY